MKVNTLSFRWKILSVLFSLHFVSVNGILAIEWCACSSTWVGSQIANYLNETTVELVG